MAMFKRSVSLKAAFVGIDVAFAKEKYLPIVIAQWQQNQLTPFPLRDLPMRPPRGLGNRATLDGAAIRSFARETVSYVKDVCAFLDVTPVRIALDAPRKPKQQGTYRREAELALDAAGISCFTTPSETDFDTIRHKVEYHLTSGGQENRLPHANQLWMLVGFELFRTFEQLAPCLEVFPQAIARAIGTGNIHKSKAGAVHEQLSVASRYTGWPGSSSDAHPLHKIAFGPEHDALDAYLSAWVAALEEEYRTPLGIPPDDVIWIPKIQDSGVPQHMPARASKKSSIVTHSYASPTPKSSSEFSRECPACHQHQFVRWPFGWDAHAAHKCQGLKGSDPEERKAEFKAKYLSRA